MSRMSHLFPTGENKSWTNHQNERPLSIWMKKTWKPSRDSRRNTTSQSIGLSISVLRDTSQRWLSGFKKMIPKHRYWGILLKGIQKYELTVMIEKNLSTNERKLQTEIQKLLSKNSQMQKSISSRWKKRNRSVYAYICTDTTLAVISL